MEKDLHLSSRGWVGQTIFDQALIRGIEKYHVHGISRLNRLGISLQSMYKVLKIEHQTSPVARAWVWTTGPCGELWTNRHRQSFGISRLQNSPMNFGRGMDDLQVQPRAIGCWLNKSWNLGTPQNLRLEPLPSRRKRSRNDRLVRR